MALDAGKALSIAVLMMSLKDVVNPTEKTPAEIVRIINAVRDLFPSRSDNTLRRRGGNMKTPDRNRATLGYFT